MQKTENNKWEDGWEWGASNKQHGLDLGQLLRYRDLLLGLVRKELTAGYQQSVLGVAWLFFQPLLTTLLYVLVFGSIVRVNTGGIPGFLFYLTGSILWAFFSDTLLGIMYTFLHQAHIFQKVYFPRLLVPLAQVLTQGFRFGIQLLLFLGVWGTWMWVEHKLTVTVWIALLPLLLLQLLLLALGLGLWLSVAVSRYRDVEPITVFLLRLAMFATPVLYPLLNVPEKWRHWFLANPLALVFEGARKGIFGEGYFQWEVWLLSWVPTMFFFFFGLRTFQKAQIKIMDSL